MSAKEKANTVTNALLVTISTIFQRSDLLAVQRKRRPWCHLHGGDSGGEEGGRPTLGCLCASGPAGRWSAPWGLQSSPVASICGWEYTLGFVCSNPICALKDPERSLSCSFSKYFAQVSKKKPTLPAESGHTRNWNKGFWIPAWGLQLSDSRLSCQTAPGGLSASCHCPQTKKEEAFKRWQSGEIINYFCALWSFSVSPICSQSKVVWQLWVLPALTSSHVWTWSQASVWDPAHRRKSCEKEGETGYFSIIGSGY